MVKHVDFSSPSFSELWQQFKNKYWYFFCYISHNIFYWKFERLQYNAYIFEQDTNFWYHCTLIFESLPYFPVFHPIVTLNELAELSTTSHSRCINYGKRNFYFGLNGIEWLSKSRGRDHREDWVTRGFKAQPQLFPLVLLVESNWISILPRRVSLELVPSAASPGG